ncbi:hypothetical protein [Bordetella petrii]|uniref:hypothetical protein n=1 Tax=Bordetella petrii TaxID=94624 RepID=UPI001E5D0277|nr:hypothetical protein [Bordetella petrii]MCD0505059.1 hypothetical protein [Bordetella petrii]
MQTDEFIARVTQIEPLKAVNEHAIRTWGADLKNLLCGYLGQGIVDHYDGFTPQQKAYLCDTIEAGMDKGDESLKTAIATGLLEALHQRAMRLHRWEEIKPLLGPHAMNYLHAWINSPY